MEAESELSSRPKEGETGYERSKRISNYYQTLSSCHQGMEGDAVSLYCECLHNAVDVRYPAPKYAPGQFFRKFPSEE